VEFDKDFYKDRVCFRCGKTRHPKAVRTVKIVAANNNKSTKSSASKVSSLTGSKADVGKLFTLINKTFKTMGKTMSQVSKKIGAFAEDGSIGAQSHALVDWDSIYAFTIRTSMRMRECLLLDNQSLVHVFCNQEYVNNIRAAERELSLQSNGGTLPIPDIANFNGFEEAVRYSNDAMTNILSLSCVKREYTERISSSTMLSMDMLIWCSSRIRADSMSMTKMTLEVMLVTLSL
jgi:hypothetical protein